MNKPHVFCLHRFGIALTAAGIGIQCLMTGSAHADAPPALTRPLDTRTIPNLATEPVFDLPPVALPDSPHMASGSAATLRRIVFQGNRSVSTATLDTLTAPYLNRPLDAADIEQLRQLITRYYIDLGHINSGAALLPNALQGETLTIHIIEGRVVTLRIKGLERLHENYVVDRLIQNEEETLNIEQLRERFQRLLDDPLFEHMNARLIPGNQPGEAILDIDVARSRPYSLSITANNYRPPSIGENAVNIAGGIRNLTGYGDQIDLSLQHARHGPGRSSLSWQLPLGSRGTRFSLQLDHGRSSVIEEPLSVLDIKSMLDSKDVGISQIVYETLRDRLTLGVHRTWRENRTELLGQPFSFVPGEPNGITRTNSWRFWQEYTHRTEKDALALRSTFTRVRNNLQEPAGLPVTTAYPASSYLTWLGQAQYARQLHDGYGTQLLARAAFQTSNRHLLALDQFAIGGVATTRGYRENLMLRDTGAVFNLEIDQPIIRNPGNGLNLSLIPFYDIGHGRNKNETGESISSVGIALRNRWQNAFVDLAVAHRLAHPDATDSLRESLQDKSIHFQMGYRFY